MKAFQYKYDGLDLSSSPMNVHTIKHDLDCKYPMVDVYASNSDNNSEDIRGSKIIPARVRGIDERDIRLILRDIQPRGII